MTEHENTPAPVTDVATITMLVSEFNRIVDQRDAAKATLRAMCGEDDPMFRQGMRDIERIEEAATLLAKLDM